MIFTMLEICTVMFGLKLNLYKSLINMFYMLRPSGNFKMETYVKCKEGKTL